MIHKPSCLPPRACIILNRYTQGPVLFEPGECSTVSGLILTILPEDLAICRLAQDPPPLPPGEGFWSLTVTEEEVSLVCREDLCPPSARREPGWRAMRVKGRLDPGMTGVLESLLKPLAEAGIAVFVLSTYDTDYVLVRRGELENACRVLEENGHAFE